MFDVPPSVPPAQRVRRIRRYSLESSVVRRPNREMCSRGIHASGSARCVSESGTRTARSPFPDRPEFRIDILAHARQRNPIDRTLQAPCVITKCCIRQFSNARHRNLKNRPRKGSRYICVYVMCGPFSYLLRNPTMSIAR